MTIPNECQYVVDDTGTPIAVIVPISVWHEISSERETSYLLKSDVMKKRLLDAMARDEEISVETAREKLGI